MTLISEIKAGVERLPLLLVMMGTIIFLNGTSSSGKTSILWDHVLGKAVHAGSFGLVLFSGMHHAIAATAKIGNNVIADHVFVEKVWVQECTRLFADRNAYLIGIQCPLEILEQRERQRKDRTLGQARAQFDVIHKYTQYDLEVDTSLLTTEECAEKIIERLESQPTAFKSLGKSL